MNEIRHLGVVVPARNEEQTISACLSSVQEAISLVRQVNPGISCQIVVVLDCCTDDTAARATGHGAEVIVSSAGRVGCARHAGALAVLQRGRRAGVPADAVWLANTDADSVVPDCWLATQLQIAATGAELVIGTVTPAALTPALDRLWRNAHELIEGHPHIHGANLGIRGSTYLAAGGFAPLSVDEDHDIVDKVQRKTDRWVATHRASVTTSGRTQSRVDGGFATFIRCLDAEDSSCA
ncbi:glycosyltransferase [Candidatus Mycobacterium wuenschmannii]|uniref:4,4'-diaponeurosporenoate glycosyltransferase n=1 Tax=Candidatus Mycobacterium wuenschmannii TaxID=3027808 RepID=A0ABY8W531_9MYCO|nr:glycosyltransferase [Candidatus Mycobacterium wuenschmannii]WIM88884.1 glycosyltransferase [Candidatus Mycobacterium wuenschmannii]